MRHLTAYSSEGESHTNIPDLTNETKQIITEVRKCNSVYYVIQQRSTLHVFGRRSHHDAHLGPAWVLSVIEIIIINGEKRVKVQGSNMPQAQSLEVVNLLHQA